MCLTALKWKKLSMTVGFGSRWQSWSILFRDLLKTLCLEAMKIIILKKSWYILRKIFLVYTKTYTRDYYFSGYSDFTQTYYNNQYIRFSVFHIIRYHHYFVLYFGVAKLSIMYISVQIDRSTIHHLWRESRKEMWITVFYNSAYSDLVQELIFVLTAYHFTINMYVFY